MISRKLVLICLYNLIFVTQNYAPRLPLNVMGSGGIPHTNMTDDALLLSQPYQSPYDIQTLYARYL